MRSKCGSSPDQFPITGEHAMSDQAEQGRGLVPVQYHQFQINDEDGPTGPDLPRDHNRLIELQDHIATVHTGDVDATVTLHTDTSSPGTPSGTRWSESHCTRCRGS